MSEKNIIQEMCLNKNGRITIPSDIRDNYDSDIFYVEDTGEEIKLTPKE